MLPQQRRDTNTAIEPPWFDRPDALALNDASAARQDVKAYARELITDGVCVVREAIPHELCDRVIADYADFCARDPGAVHRDPLGRETRLVNFHRTSNASAEMGTNPELMNLLDYLFGMEACLYTSLTFKYGTQQPIHRDTPHFGTWPQGYYFGVWIAMEDVSEDAGPLMLHRGAHKFRMDQDAMMDELAREHPEINPEALADLALRKFCDEVMGRSLTDFGPPEFLPVNKGDVIIWHPELPHGGSLAKNPHLTRWSTVFHCAPVAVQVHQHQTFFRHRSSDAPPARYGYIDYQGRKVAVAGDTGFD